MTPADHIPLVRCRVLDPAVGTHTVALSLHSHLCIVFLTLRGLGADRCECGPLLFVSPDIQQLFADCVLGSEAIFDVYLEEREIPHAALHQTGISLTTQAWAIWATGLRPFRSGKPGSRLEPFADHLSIFSVVVESLAEQKVPAVSSVFARNGESTSRCSSLTCRSFTVEIANGRFVGERYTHVFSSGSSTDEWCAGIQLVGVNNVNIRATTISDFTGEGICMGSTTTSGMSKHVTLSDVICTGNRRQGVSLTGCDYVWIYDSEFNETQGTAPSDGIDIEPQGTDYVTNVTIENCVMRGNAGNGLQMNANNTNITHIGIVNCLFAYNYYAGIYAQTSNGGTVDTGTMYGNALFQNGYYGLYMPGGTHFIIGGYSKNGTDSNCFGNNMVTYPTNQNNYVYPISPNGWATPANTQGYVAGNDMNITAPSSNTVQ